MDIDLTALTDEEIDALRVRVLTAIEHRENIRRIPEEVAELCRTYREGGGDPDDLVAAITTPGD